MSVDIIVMTQVKHYFSFSFKLNWLQFAWEVVATETEHNKIWYKKIQRQMTITLTQYFHFTFIFTEHLWATLHLAKQYIAISFVEQ